MNWPQALPRHPQALPETSEAMQDHYLSRDIPTASEPHTFSAARLEAMLALPLLAANAVRLSPEKVGEHGERYLGCAFAKHRFCDSIIPRVCPQPKA